MNPICLIESNVPGINSEKLEFEFQRCGISTKFVKFMPNTEVPYDIAGAEKIPHSAHVIFFGSLTTMRHIQRTRQWKPGGWCNFEAFNCSTYYSYFGRYLTNTDFIVLPIAEVKRRFDSLADQFGGGDELFLRPDEADKSFTGAVVDSDDLKDLFRGHQFDERKLVIVAKPKRIEVEWRLIIANSKAIAGSQYKVGNEFMVDSLVPEDVVQFANGVLERIEWRPDALFVMDIAKTEIGLSIVELNPFSCAGHMESDTSAIVESVLKNAKLAW